MVEIITLSQQVQSKFNLGSEEAKNLVIEASSFRDADLNKISSSRGEYLTVEIRYPQWIFLDSDKDVDQLSVLLFHFFRPGFSSNWGSDDEIRRCIIYDFSISGNEFKIDTGDGGRHGTFDISKSTVELITTKEILDQLNYRHPNLEYLEP